MLCAAATLYPFFCAILNFRQIFKFDYLICTALNKFEINRNHFKLDPINSLRPNTSFGNFSLPLSFAFSPSFGSNFNWKTLLKCDSIKLRTIIYRHKRGKKIVSVLAR